MFLTKLVLWFNLANFLRKVCSSPLYFFSISLWNVPGDHLQTIIQPEQASPRHILHPESSLYLPVFTHTLLRSFSSCSFSSLGFIIFINSLFPSLSATVTSSVAAQEYLISLRVLMFALQGHSLQSPECHLLRRTAIKQCFLLLPPSSLSLFPSFQRINPFICSSHPLGRVVVPSSFILSFMSFLSPVLAAAVVCHVFKPLLALQSYQFFYSVYCRVFVKGNMANMTCGTPNKASFECIKQK